MAHAFLNATINYAAATPVRQRYYANDHTRDTVEIDARTMVLANGRQIATSLDEQGFVLCRHASAVQDFEDRARVAAVHPGEIAALLKALSGADEVLVTAPGILRFSERSGRAGSLDNSMPARFAHVDATAQTSAGFAARLLPAGRSMRRYAHFNVWRAFNGPPQDVPLALCDATSVAPGELLVADAIFDAPGMPEWGFESWLLAHGRSHRWHWFPDMSPGEVLVFKTSDSALHNAVPHVAFDNPLAPADCPPRASIEMRALAFWYG